MANLNKRKELLDVVNQFYNQPVARVSFELVITVVVVMFFALFAIRPTLVTMSDLIKEIDDKKQLNSALGQKISALSTAQGQYLSLQSRLGLLDQAIPNKPELLDSLKIIEKIASDRRVAIKTLDVVDFPSIQAADTASDAASIVTQPTRQNLTINLTASGDYPTIKQFINDLQQSRRKIVVSLMSFASSETSNGKTLEVTMTLNLPYFGVQP